MAIDPQRLQLELDQLAELTADPRRLQRGLLKLIERYQVRRRSAGRLQSVLPRPVLAGLERSLRGRLQGDPAATVEIAAALWGAERHETRILAARLLAHEPTQRVADLIESWTHGPVSLELLRELADVGLEAWRRTNPDRFLEQTERWLQGKQRLLGLYALEAAVRDPKFEHLPQVYQLIGGLGSDLRGRPRRALIGLMRALAGRAPTETVQFLRKELGQRESAARRIVREILHSLPPDQRQALRSPNGIIRARADHPQDGERNHDLD